MLGANGCPVRRRSARREPNLRHIGSSGATIGVASLDEVAALIEAITPRCRAAVLLAAWCGLRRGEVLGLYPEDVDLEAGTVTIRRNRVELLESPVAFDGPPKDASYRTVNIPPHVLPVLAEHMADWAGPDRVFVGGAGYPMRGDAVRQAFARARGKVGMEGFTFRDLRHTGQTLAAAAGASLNDLMKRLGHSSSAAATRYLHAVEGRDAEIAAALSELARHGDTAKLPGRSPHGNGISVISDNVRLVAGCRGRGALTSAGRGGKYGQMEMVTNPEARLEPIWAGTTKRPLVERGAIVARGSRACVLRAGGRVNAAIFWSRVR